MSKAPTGSAERKELPMICRLGIHMYYELPFCGERICSTCYHREKYSEEEMEKYKQLEFLRQFSTSLF